MFKSLIKLFLTLGFVAVAVPSVLGFALQGPLEPYQVPAIGYLDNTGPKNIGDGFRWNTPVVYYAYDSSFLSFFGTTAQTEIDKAYNYFNNLTNYSAIDPNAYPLNVDRINSTASQLNLVDIRSTTLSRIVSILGLDSPELYVWTMKNRFLNSVPNAVCPANEVYVVIQRNFDPITYTYSSYVNNVLFTYVIQDSCPNTTTPQAEAIPTPVDGSVTDVSAVASGNDPNVPGVTVGPTTASVIVRGRYLNGLTRDDVGGLKYLMNRSSVQQEGTPNGAYRVTTNAAAAQLVVSQDYATFLQASLTNTPANFLALYPNLQIVSTNQTFGVAVTTNYTLTFTTNYPPYLPPLTAVISVTLVPTYSTNVIPFYSYVFGNIQILHLYTNAFFSTASVSLTPSPYQPPGSGILKTNYTTTTSFLPEVNGDFIITPTNSCAGYQIISTNLVTVTPNVLGFFTENFTGVTTNIYSTVTQSITNYSYSTNYTLLVYPTSCDSNVVAVRGGIDKMTFVRRDYDSLLSSYWSPVTNTFQMLEFTNGVAVTNTYRRVVTQPDILITSVDQLLGPSDPAIQDPIVVTNVYDTSHESADGLGPGIAYPQIKFVYGKGGNAYLNLTPGTQAGVTGAQTYYQWATFDGSTNAPTVYPSSTSLQGLVSALFFQITNSAFPYYSLNAKYTKANPYKAPLGVSGGTAPYTWSLAPTSPGGLPTGLVLTNISGVEYLYGTGPTNAASGTTYDFYLQATDSSSPAKTAFGSCSFYVNP